MTESYWGSIGNIEMVVTPVGVLKEQADKLGKLSEYTLSATVVTGEGSFPDTDKFHTTLCVRASGFQEFTLDIVSIYYTLRFYPLTLSNDLTRNAADVECVDENDFREKLRSILSSEETSMALKQLCALASSV